MFFPMRRIAKLKAHKDISGLTAAAIYTKGDNSEPYRKAAIEAIESLLDAKIAIEVISSIKSFAYIFIEGYSNSDQQRFAKNHSLYRLDNELPDILTKVKSEDMEKGLCELLDINHSGIIRFAIRSLGLIGSIAAVSKIIEHYMIKGEFREVAINALGKIGGDEAITFLTNEFYKQLGLDDWRDYDANGPELESEDLISKIREFGCLFKALGNIDDDETAWPILIACCHPDFEVQLDQDQGVEITTKYRPYCFLGIDDIVIKACRLVGDADVVNFLIALNDEVSSSNYYMKHEANTSYGETDEELEENEIRGKLINELLSKPSVKILIEKILNNVYSVDHHGLRQLVRYVIEKHGDRTYINDLVDFLLKKITVNGILGQSLHDRKSSDDQFAEVVIQELSEDLIYFDINRQKTNEHISALVESLKEQAFEDYLICWFLAQFTPLLTWSSHGKNLETVYFIIDELARPKFDVSRDLIERIEFHTWR